MPKLEIVKIGHPVLRKPAGEVPAAMLKSRAFRSFLEDMVATMRTADGVGLAANQVGRDVQALVLECAANARYPQELEIPLEMWINPVLVAHSDETEDGWEGCLSIPGYRGRVPRFKEVTFRALDPEGKPETRTARGFYARILQHEIDHLRGFFYMDRMPDLHHWMHLDAFNDFFKQDVRDNA